jgi:aminoglycoside phosphotransferase (APT) family kinase protein
MTPAPDEALAAACAQADLSAGDARILYRRANIVYLLPAAGLVARLRRSSGSPALLARLSASVQVTSWLHGQDFPTVTPAAVAVSQPVSVPGYVVTFWQYLAAVRWPETDVAALARLLRQLHQLPAPPVSLPQTSPFGSLADDVRRCAWLTGRQRSWILDQCQELGGQYGRITWTLGQGLIHGDAYEENLIHTRDGQVVLADWDSVGHAPREQDLVPTSIRRRFGLPTAQWHEFCQVYGVDANALPGFSLLERIRELRTLTAYVRTNHPQAIAEVRRRLRDLMSGTAAEDQAEPWRGFNLAS